jgi:hypothetical protein
MLVHAGACVCANLSRWMAGEALPSLIALRKAQTIDRMRQKRGGGTLRRSHSVPDASSFAVCRSAPSTRPSAG